MGYSVGVITGVVQSAPVVVGVNTYPVTITLIPGAGNTSLCEFTTSNLSGVPVWQQWPEGVVSSITCDGVDFPIKGLRFTRVSGSSNDTYEVVL